MNTTLHILKNILRHVYAEGYRQGHVDTIQREYVRISKSNDDSTFTGAIEHMHLSGQLDELKTINITQHN